MYIKMKRTKNRLCEDCDCELCECKCHSPKALNRKMSSKGQEGDNIETRDTRESPSSFVKELNLK